MKENQLKILENKYIVTATKKKTDTRCPKRYRDSWKENEWFEI